ncbi:MAG TPA: hypothetical protein VFB43_00235 [Terracidiphilus sp.]|nr:hypothetical protein [Terracidiphilus sp.]
MKSNTTGQELKEQLDLIQTMIAEGRQSTQSWGWSFLLWGVAYYIAAAWTMLGHTYWAWPVTMTVAIVLSAIIGSRVSRGHPETVFGRAIGSVWKVMGVTLFVVLAGLGVSGHYNIHVYMAIIGGMLAVANGTSSLILRWKMQFVCGLMWLGAGVAGSFGSENQAAIAFLAAVFFCQIVFGIYAMMLDARRRAPRGAAHV